MNIILWRILLDLLPNETPIEIEETGELTFRYNDTWYYIVSDEDGDELWKEVITKGGSGKGWFRQKLGTCTEELFLQEFMKDKNMRT